MRINDNQRREVAERLRQRADAHYAVEASRVARALGLEYEVYGTVVTFNSAAVQALADLIDRPTCRLDLTDVETYGNLKVRIYECSECGRTCEEIYGKYERCPHCGREVVADD